MLNQLIPYKHTCSFLTAVCMWKRLCEFIYRKHLTLKYEEQFMYYLFELFHCFHYKLTFLDWIKFFFSLSCATKRKFRRDGNTASVSLEAWMWQVHGELSPFQLIGWLEGTMWQKYTRHVFMSRAQPLGSQSPVLLSLALAALFTPAAVGDLSLNIWESTGILERLGW